MQGFRYHGSIAFLFSSSDFWSHDSKMVVRAKVDFDMITWLTPRIRIKFTSSYKEKKNVHDLINSSWLSAMVIKT